MLAINTVKKHLYSAKTSTALKREIIKTAEATGDLIGDEIADKITLHSKKVFTKCFKDRWKWKYQEKDVYFKKGTTNYWWIKISMKYK